MLVMKIRTIWALGVPPRVRGFFGVLLAPDLRCLMMLVMKIGTIWGSGWAPLHQTCLGLVPGRPSGFELRFDNACDDNLYDLCVPPPPLQRCLGLAPGPPPDLCCVPMMLMMRIGPIRALGVPPPTGEVSWGAPGRPPASRFLLMMLMMEIGKI